MFLMYYAALIIKYLESINYEMCLSKHIFPCVQAQNTRKFCFCVACPKTILGTVSIMNCWKGIRTEGMYVDCVNALWLTAGLLLFICLVEGIGSSLPGEKKEGSSCLSLRAFFSVFDSEHDGIKGDNLWCHKNIKLNILTSERKVWL